MRVLSSLLYLLNRNRSSWNQLALKPFLFFYFAEVLPVFPHMMFPWSATLQLDLICYLPLLNYCAKMKKLFPGNVLYLLEILHLLLALVALICRVIGSCLRGISFFIFSIMWNRTCCRKSPPPIWYFTVWIKGFCTVQQMLYHSKMSMLKTMLEVRAILYKRKNWVLVFFKIHLVA